MAYERLRALLAEFDAQLEPHLGPVHPLRVEIRQLLDRLLSREREQF